MRRRIASIERITRLRALLGLLFLGLAIPSGFLVRQGFAQIELAEFRRQQLLAESLVRSVDARLSSAIAVEEARPPTDFDYAVGSIDDAGDAVQLSPLASLAATSAFPGTIGYFQVDAEGSLSTPLLPDSGDSSLSDPERPAKIAVENELAEVLEANRLTRFRQAEEGERDEQGARLLDSADETFANAIRGQAAFDELVASDAAAALAESAPEPAIDQDTQPAEQARSAIPVSAFAGELEPLRFGALETGHFVLFRNAWRDGERYVQGMLIDRAEFIDVGIGRAFRNAGLASGTTLTVAAAGNTLASISMGAPDSARIDGSALYAARLSPPLADIEIAFSSGALGRGPGFGLLVWTSIALGGVLVGGFVAMYRFGVQQMRLAQQQQNFVSAVSHELKTPLTSIRMYGEMLKSGWADDAKKQLYYDYIFDEGERLSRLIDNVLQLARLSRGGPDISLECVSVREILDVLGSKLATQAERADFELELTADPEARDVMLAVDMDALSQVFINLVDNAIKFSSEAARRQVVITARCENPDKLAFTVRDFGPGIPAAEMKRLFELFYRPDNELTRTTAGTGIGLALVRQLVAAMSGHVDVMNRDPGTEFRLEFPRATQRHASETR